jgi:ferredoxin
MRMIATYGYKDGSGEYYIQIDTDKCNGCGDCVKACPQNVFEVTEDPNDPLRDGPVAIVTHEVRKKLKYVCTVCKPVKDRPPLPCVKVCPQGAIIHLW